MCVCACVRIGFDLHVDFSLYCTSSKLVMCQSSVQVVGRSIEQV